MIEQCSEGRVAYYRLQTVRGEDGQLEILAKEAVYRPAEQRSITVFIPERPRAAIGATK